MCLVKKLVPINHWFCWAFVFTINLQWPTKWTHPFHSHFYERWKCLPECFLLFVKKRSREIPTSVCKLVYLHKKRVSLWLFETNSCIFEALSDQWYIRSIYSRKVGCLSSSEKMFRKRRTCCKLKIHVP